MTREDAEARLTFGGFAVFGCPIKPQSGPALEILRGSSHELIMITGDAPLTACHVAREPTWKRARIFAGNARRSRPSTRRASGVTSTRSIRATRTG